MRTTFRVRQPYADIFQKCADAYVNHSPALPEHFISVMEHNRGAAGGITGFGLDEEGLEYKNPLIVALGDSVTAGHFEALVDMSDPMPLIRKAAEVLHVTAEELLARVRKEGMDSVMRALPVPPGGNPPVEITDARESYVEKFREMLIDRYEQTSVSVINSGIAGDILTMMAKRAERDVIRYQPDLVLINGSLNWSDAFGDTAFYKKTLVSLVRRIREETPADIVLLTPNGITMDRHSEETLAERVQAIRETAEEEKTCLADTYAVWEEARDRGCPWKELLANGMNHPAVDGHVVYAKVLMKLFA